MGHPTKPLRRWTGGTSPLEGGVLALRQVCCVPFAHRLHEGGADEALRAKCNLYRHYLPPRRSHLRV